MLKTRDDPGTRHVKLHKLHRQVGCCNDDDNIAPRTPTFPTRYCHPSSSPTHLPAVPPTTPLAMQPNKERQRKIRNMLHRAFPKEDTPEFDL